MKNKLYGTNASIFLASILFSLSSCGDVSVEYGLPMPANRTQPAVIKSVELVDDKLVVKWTKVSGANKYNLYYGTKSGVTSDTNEGLITSATESTTMDGVKQYTDYYYTVTSFNSKGLESEPSNEYKYVAPLPEPTPTPGAPPGNPIGDCTKTHTMPGHTPVWSFLQCNPVTGLRVFKNTPGEDGSTLGNTSINYGRVSFSVTGASNAQYDPTYTLVFITMMKAVGLGTGEANWHWLSFGTGPAIEARLVVQRFDGTCPKFCDHSTQEFGLWFSDPKDAWTWDCSWDTANVSCNIYKNGGLLSKVTRDTKGPFNTLDYWGLGDKTTSGYAGLTGKFSNIRMTIFK